MNPDRVVTQLLQGIQPVFNEAEIKGVYFDLDNFDYIKESYEVMAYNQYKTMANIIEPWIEPRLRVALKDNAKKKKPLSEHEVEKKVFNPGSIQQKADILFKYFGMSEVKKGKSGGASVDKEVVESLLRHKDTTEDGKTFLKALSTYSALRKLITSYLDNANEMLDGNIYHPNYQINGTITGRHSSGFHTLPKKSDIKRLFISRWAKEGGIFGCFDFSQLELRVVASLANEEKWIKAFEEGVDIHAATASVCFNVPLTKVSSDQRKQAKTVNFGLIYGLSDKSLGEQLNITTKAAAKIKDGLFSGCEGLSDWFQECYDEVDATHKIVTVFRRTIPIDMKNFRGEEDKEANHRRSVNYKVQSPASDLVTDSIARIYRAMKRKKMKSIIVGSVHDSILFDIYPGELLRLVKLVKHTCEVENRKLYPWLKCPVVVDCTLGTSWGGCLDFDVDFTDKGMLLKSEGGLRKDYRMLFDAMDKAYTYSYEITKTEEIPPDKQPKDRVIKDKFKWDVEILM
jgi:DNA polymerase-1